MYTTKHHVTIDGEQKGSFDTKHEADALVFKLRLANPFGYITTYMMTQWVKA